jgi:hypothetical protein
MAGQKQSDSTLGTAGSGDGAPRPMRTTPVRPGGKGEVPAPGSARSDPGSGGKHEDRPGSNPKNPGDFGHH